MGRKLGRDGGGAMAVVLDEVRATIGELQASDDQRLSAIAAALGKALEDQERSTQVLLEALQAGSAAAMGAGFDYLMQTGYLFGGWQMGRSALVALKQLAFSYPWWTVYEWGKVTKALETQLVNAVDGKISPQEAMAAAQQAADNILGPYAKR